MIQRPSCAVGEYGSLEFLGKARDEAAFVFTLERKLRLPYNYVKQAINEFSDDWDLCGLNEQHNLVFAVRVTVKPAESYELFMQTNLAIIAGNLADKLNGIHAQIALAQQMQDTEERLPVAVC